MAAPLLDHLREESEDQPHGAEIIELHRALEVVEAIKRIDNGAADRTPRVVHEKFDGRMLGEDFFGDRVDCIHVGQVAGVGEAASTGLGDLLARRFKLVRIARDDDDRRAGAGQLPRRRLTDAR